VESDLAADPAMRQRQHLHCHLVLAGECGRDGVVVHDNVPHPDMAFDDEERPQ
jgi:hypothetical protein